MREIVKHTDRQYAEYDWDDTNTGTYTYNKPTVRIIIDEISMDLTVSENNMTWKDEDGVSYTFKKQ